MRRDPGPERLREVDARAAALDAAAPRRGQRARLRPRRLRRPAAGAQAREPRLGRGVVLQEDVLGREPELRGALLRDEPAADRGPDPGDPRAGRLSLRQAERADGESLARDAAEGRSGAGAPHLAGPAAARRADDRARPSLEARGAGVRPRDPVGARRDDPPLHARPRTRPRPWPTASACSTAAGCSSSRRFPRSASASG